MHFHSPVGNENKGVDAVEPASSDSPPDCRILDLRIRPPAIQTHKKTNPERIGLFVVGEDGFEPSKRNAADLQSVPFGHSGTPPDMWLCLKDLAIIARISDLSRGKMKVFWEMKNEALLTQYEASFGHEAKRAGENSFFMMRSIASCAQHASCAARRASLKKA